MIVTAKVNPDLDGVACIMGYAHLLKSQGKDVQIGIYGTPQAEVQYFAKHYLVHIPTLHVDLSSISSTDQVVIVDGSSLKGMHPMITPDQVVELIDHRTVDFKRSDFPHAHVHIEQVGAAATLIIERLRESRVTIPREISLLLTGAIYHNTLDLQSTNTTPHDREALSFLKTHGEIPPDLSHQMFAYVDRQLAHGLEQALKHDGKQIMVKDTHVGCYQLILWQAVPELVARALTLTRSFDQDRGLAWSFLIVSEISNRATQLHCIYPEGRRLLTDELQVRFEGQSACTSTLLLRKQILEKLLV